MTTEEKYDIRIAPEHAGIRISSTDDLKIDVIVTLTSPLLRNNSVGAPGGKQYMQSAFNSLSGRLVHGWLVSNISNWKSKTICELSDNNVLNIGISSIVFLLCSRTEVTKSTKNVYVCKTFLCHEQVSNVFNRKSQISNGVWNELKGSAEVIYACR